MSQEYDTEKKNQVSNKKYISGEESPYVEDDNSNTFTDEFRRIPKAIPRKIDFANNKSNGEESMTQDQIEFFKSMRLKSTKRTNGKIEQNIENNNNSKEEPQDTQSNFIKSKLSSSTLELIRKVKDKASKVDSDPDDKQKQVSKILTKPSLRERFANVQSITNVKELLQHHKYKQIVTNFENIDQMVSFLKQRKQTPFWNQIQLNLYDSFKYQITLCQLQQILSVWPQAYNLSWMINEKIIRIDRYDLIIQISSQCNLENRVDEFKLKLLQYIQTNGEHIEEAELPPRPDKPQAQLVEDYVKQVEESTDQTSKIPQQQSRAYEILKRLAEKNSKNNNTELTGCVNLTKHKGKIGSVEKSALSERLLEKVRQKEQALKNQTSSQQITHSKENVIHIATILYNYYISRQVSNMFMVNVIGFVKNNNKRTLFNEQQIQDILTFLSKISPNWIKIVENPSGRIVRMDQSTILPMVLKEIENQMTQNRLN